MTQHTCSLKKVQNFLRIQKLLLLNKTGILVTKSNIKHNVAHVLMLSHVRLFATPWTVALQAPLFMGILQARILEWVAMPSSRVLPNPGIKPMSPALQVDSLPSEPPKKPKNIRVGNLSFRQGTFQPRNRTRSPVLQADSLPAELPGKPNIALDISLLQM